MRTIWLLVFALAACGKSDKTDDKASDKPAAAKMDVQTEAAVEFAQKQLPEMDKQLASDDPGAASSTCAVIKPDLAKIEKADPKLAATIKERCGHDLALRSLTVFVERAEAARKKDPGARFLSECSSFEIYMKPVTAAGAEADPAIPKLRERHAAACPK